MKNTKTKQPYQPVPFRKGNTLVRLYEVDFVNKAGSEALVTKADYEVNGKNGKLIKGHILYIKWLD